MALRLFAALFFVFFHFGCTSTSKKAAVETPAAGDTSQDLRGDSPANVGASMQSFVDSKESKPDQATTQSELDKLLTIPSDKRSLPTYAAILTLQRLSGKNFAELIRTTRALMTEELKRDVNRSVPLPIRLELALGAIEANRLSLAEYFLSELLESKDRGLQAAALTATGLIYLKDDKLPEATSAFEEALKIDGSFEAARFNLGLLAARFADFNLAKRLLGPRHTAAMIAAQRLSEGDSEAQKLCANPEGAVENYNCGLFYLQNRSDLEAAQMIFDRLAKGQAPASIKELAFRRIAEIQEMRTQRTRATQSKEEQKNVPEGSAKQEEEQKQGE